MADFVASHAGPWCASNISYKPPTGTVGLPSKIQSCHAAMVQGKLQIWRWNALNGHAKQFLKPLRGSDKETTSKLALDVSGPGGYMIHDTCMHFKMEEIRSIYTI